MACATRNPRPFLGRDEFIRVAESLALGSRRDGWLVVWCQPDRQWVLWHVMLLRHGSSFAVAAIENAKGTYVKDRTRQTRFPEIVCRAVCLAYCACEVRSDERRHK